MTPVRLEPAALRSRVKHSTTEPLRSHKKKKKKYVFISLKIVSILANSAAVLWRIPSDSSLFAEAPIFFISIQNEKMLIVEASKC